MTLFTRSLLRRAAVLAVLSASAAGAAAEPATRESVRDALEMARASGRVTPDGEIGDTPEVLRAREDFAALQHEVQALETARARHAGRTAVSQGELDYETLTQLLALPAAPGRASTVLLEHGGNGEDAEDAEDGDGAD